VFLKQTSLRFLSFSAHLAGSFACSCVSPSISGKKTFSALVKHETQTAVRLESLSKQQIFLSNHFIFLRKRREEKRRTRRKIKATLDVEWKKIELICLFDFQISAREGGRIKIIYG
jgi:hypothetical protein